MKIATLGIVFQDDHILLSEKKRGEIGTGVLSGPGGKLEPGETLEECMIRETREELGVELDPVSLELAAYITFHKGITRFILFNKLLNFFRLKSSIPDFGVFVYRALLLPNQRLAETEDMIPGWYPCDDLPLNRMYEADRHWLPKAIRGKKFNANVHYFGRARGFNRIEFLVP